MTDIIIAENGLSRQDELEFAKALQFLGMQKLLILQPPRKGRVKTPDIPNIKIHTGLIFDSDNYNSSGSYTDKIRVLDARRINNEKLREIIEKHDFEIIINFSGKNSRKTMHFPSGAINQVTAALMKQKSIIAVFSPEDIEYLNTAMFNSKALSKEKVRMAFCSNAKMPLQLRNEKDLLAIASLIGLDESIVKESKLSIDTAIAYKSYNSDTITSQR